MGGGMAKVAAIVAVILAVLGGGAKAITLCNVTEEGYNTCRPSITPPNPVPPSPACCAVVSGADLKCLCGYKNSVMLPTLGIDANLALALPGKCNVPSPQC